MQSRGVKLNKRCLSVCILKHSSTKDVMPDTTGSFYEMSHSDLNSYISIPSSTSWLFKSYFASCCQILCWRGFRFSLTPLNKSRISKSLTFQEMPQGFNVTLLWLYDFLLETVVFTCVDVLILLIMQCLCPANPGARSCNSFYSPEITLNSFFLLFL